MLSGVLFWHHVMQNASFGGSGRVNFREKCFRREVLEVPLAKVASNESQEGAKKGPREAKEVPRTSKLLAQMVPRPPQESRIVSLGMDWEVILEEK